MNEKHKKGIISQLLAQSYLAKQENTIVFTPLDGLGMIDIVTYNTKTKEYKNYDVKTVSYRKNQTHRCKPGTRINRCPSKRQKQHQVEIIYVTEQGEVYQTLKRNFKNK
jgi:hypothetical protein